MDLSTLELYKLLNLALCEYYIDKSNDICKTKYQNMCIIINNHLDISSDDKLRLCHQIADIMLPWLSDLHMFYDAIRELISFSESHINMKHELDELIISINYFKERQQLFFEDIISMITNN